MNLDRKPVIQKRVLRNEFRQKEELISVEAQYVTNMTKPDDNLQNHSFR